MYTAAVRYIYICLEETSALRQSTRFTIRVTMLNQKNLA